MIIKKITFDEKEEKVKNELDQFYTKLDVAKICVINLLEILEKLNYKNIEKIEFIEPSGGYGSFITSLEIKGIKKIISFDLQPKHPKIKEKDFLTVDLKYKKERVVIGNPPFGKRSKLAIDFFNRSSSFSDTIAFIVPLQFRKWSVQSKLNRDMKLIYDLTLDENSFTTINNKDYKVRCCFQIWTKLEGFSDLRIKTTPETTHKDFKMWQYNNTKETLKYFEENFDFAVPRQGYCNYLRREIDKENCEKTTQWMLFKAKNKKILKILMNLDFEKLSKNNTTIPGFGKADVIKMYNERKNKK